MKQDCPFCDLEDRVLKENAHAFVILSDPRKMPGHCLVIPKRHIEKPWEISHEELQDVFDLVFFIEQKIIGKLGDGCDVRQNYRPFMTESKLSVHHIHFHVYPRYFKDYVYKMSEQYETDLFTGLDPVEAKEFAKLLR
jgi:diadenosine tetraphosphate (Ap4A) HIT family hydrolase